MSSTTAQDARREPVNELELQIATREDGKRFVYIAGLPKGREFEFVDIVAKILAEEKEKTEAQAAAIKETCDETASDEPQFITSAPEA